MPTLYQPDREAFGLVRKGVGQSTVLRAVDTPYPKVNPTRSSWLNCALRDDEAVYWVSIGHYEAVAVGN